MMQSEIIVGAMALAGFFTLVISLYFIEKRKAKKNAERQFEIINNFHLQRVERQERREKLRESITARVASDVSNAIIDNGEALQALQSEPLPSKSNVKSYHQLKKRSKHKK